MFSFCRRFIFTILLAQWLYAEALVFMPTSQPMLDTITRFLTPPTHDKWVETYRAIQEQQGKVVASAKVISESAFADELIETVENFKSHNSFGDFR